MIRHLIAGCRNDCYRMKPKAIDAVESFRWKMRVNIFATNTINEVFKLVQEFVLVLRMCDGLKLMPTRFFLSLYHDSCNLGVKSIVFLSHLLVLCSLIMVLIYYSAVIVSLIDSLLIPI